MNDEQSWREELKAAQARTTVSDDVMIAEDWPHWQSYSSNPLRPMTVGDVQSMRTTRYEYRNAVFGRHAERSSLPCPRRPQAPTVAMSEQERCCGHCHPEVSLYCTTCPLHWYPLPAPAEAGAEGEDGG